jgi:hypothetical protein
MSLDFFKPEHHLLIDFTKTKIQSQIIDRIKELKFNDLTKYKNDVQFLKLVCNIIEHLVSKDDNIKKLDLCIDVFNQLFGNLSDDEIKTLTQNVNFLCNNKNIKKLSYYKLFKTSFLEWFISSKSK